MKAWDIWTGDVYGPHPVVLISCQARIDAKPEVMVLKCTTMQPAKARAAKENEALLDEADGLDWKTLCRCDLLFALPKATLTKRRGSVTLERRREIARKIIQGLAIAGL
jgi:mRNA-degrading endonuclease toxin of MazEF toxin-antitoxin module